MTDHAILTDDFERLCVFLFASPIVSNPRQERQASGNEVDLDDEGMFTSLIVI